MNSRDLVRRILTRMDLEALADKVVAALAERRGGAPLHPTHEEQRTWVRWNIDLAVRWFADGRGPTRKELGRFEALARAGAARGLPSDTLPAEHRLGARLVWAQLLENAGSEEQAALLQSADLVLEYVDRVSRVLHDAHASAVPPAEEQAALALLTRIIHDEDLTAEDHRLAERIGFDPAWRCRPFVIASPVRSAHRHAALASRLRRAQVLAVARERRVCGLAREPLPWPELGAGPDTVMAQADPAARHELGTVLDELRAAVDIAVHRGHGGLIAVDDYLPELLLHRSPRIAGRVHARVYGRLEAEHPELAQTLDRLIQHDFDRRRTAAALPVHRNTLNNRLHRIQQITGIDLDATDGRALAWLAWLTRGDKQDAHRPRAAGGIIVHRTWGRPE